jgi:CheY-like chemotaxis protein
MSDDTRPLIIVAEDEPLLRLVLAQNLEDCGFRVHEAADGLAAWQYAQKEPDCCLLISDVRMPVMDGYTLAEKLLEAERHPPVLLLTGYAGPIPYRLRDRIMVLHKPVPMEMLCDYAKKLCSGPATTQH